MITALQARERVEQAQAERLQRLRERTEAVSESISKDIERVSAEGKSCYVAVGIACDIRATVISIFQENGFKINYRNRSADAFEILW